MRQVLIEIFEQWLPELEQALNSFELEVVSPKINMTLAYFETGNTIFSIRPNNFDELKNNQEF